MNALLRSVKRRLVESGFYPRSGLARFTVWVGALYVASEILAFAIAGSSKWNTEVAERVRSAALVFPNGLDVLAGLVSNDADWVIQHAQEVIGDQPARARVVLFRLNHPESRERLIRSIPSESPGLRVLMASAVSDEIKDPTEKAKLLKLLR